MQVLTPSEPPNPFTLLPAQASVAATRTNPTRDPRSQVLMAQSSVTFRRRTSDLSLTAYEFTGVC